MATQPTQSGNVNTGAAQGQQGTTTSSGSTNWGALGGAAIGSLVDVGSAVGGGIFNARQAQANREFQRDMYMNRWQMSVDDMRKAGINPILAAQGGLGGPGGGVSGSAASMQAPPGIGSRAVQNALAVKMQKEQRRNIRAQTRRDENQAYMFQILGDKAYADRKHTESREAGQRLLNEITRLNTWSARTNALWHKTGLGHFSKGTSLANEILNPLSRAKRLGRSMDKFMSKKKIGNSRRYRFRR